MRRFLFLANLCLSLASAADLAKEGVRWWSHIQVLADDGMQGRNTGSIGHQRAAQFVAGEFERAGLNGAGTDGYMQPVKLDVRELAEEASNLAIIRKANVLEPLALGEDATISFRGDLAGQVNAPAVFVGNGLVIPENNVDDLAGL